MTAVESTSLRQSSSISYPDAAFFQLLAAPEILDATPNSLDCDEWLI